MNYYQDKHDKTANYLFIAYNSDYSYPLHLHNSFEFILCTGGEMTVEIDGDEYTLTKGEGVITFPLSMHLINTPVRGSHMLYVFSSDMVPEFFEQTVRAEPVTNKFTPCDGLLKRLTDLRHDDSVYRRKSVLYELCADFNDGAKWSPRSGDKPYSSDLLKKSLLYINANLTNDFSLNSMARELGYNQAYLSHRFNDLVGMTVTAYVNMMRINYAAQMLADNDSSILHISETCGYESPRTFNRNFFNQKGMTPTQYRQSLAAKAAPAKAGD